MSELGNFIRAEITRQGIQYQEMASRVGLSASHLSQVISGNRRGFNHETLSRMIEGISSDPHVQAKFLESYFRDHALPKLKKWIHVTPPESAHTKEDPANYGNGGDAVEKVCSLLTDLALPTDTVHDLRTIIGAIPHYSALHDLIRDLAAFTRDAFPHEPGTVVLKTPAKVVPSSSSRKRHVRYSAGTSAK